MNPATPLSAVTEVIPDLDLLLVMTVNPGFGGQSFIRPVCEKIRRIRTMAAGRPIDIQVDGGVNPETAAEVAAAGANVLVAGSAVFKGGRDSYADNIAAIRRGAELAIGRAA